MQTQATTKDKPEDLKQDVAQLRSDLNKLLSDVSEISKRRGHDALDKGKDAVNDAEARVKEFSEDVSGKVRERPLTAVALAFGAGALLAYATRR